MKRNLYAIYDHKACSIVGGVVQCLGTDAEAARMFEGVVRAGNNMVAQHPDDFSLVGLGEIDCDTLQVDPYAVHKIITSGSAVANAAREVANASV